MAAQFVPEFHRARLTVVAAAALTFLWRFGFPIEGEVPFVRLPIRNEPSLPYVLAAILAYGLIRLFVEWAQAQPSLRQQRSARLETGATVLVAIVAATMLARAILPAETFSARSVVAGLALTAVGIALGEFLGIVLFGLPMIRSKEEASRLALHRVPAAVRASWRSSVVILPLVVLSLCLAPSLTPPISSLWPWLLFLPAAFFSLSSFASMVSRRVRTRDGTMIRRADWLRRLRTIHDRHDVGYLVGGWDQLVPPSNSSLYSAAERGDRDSVRSHIEGGCDPNEQNMHGWRPLLIAVANQHLGTTRVLLELGANPSLGNILGRTPLMFAARYGHEELARLLLQYGADPNLNESTDPGALSTAAGYGHGAVVRLLLDAGADPTLRDFEGRTAIDIAEQAQQGEIAALLRRVAHARSGVVGTQPGREESV